MAIRQTTVQGSFCLRTAGSSTALRPFVTCVSPAWQPVPARLQHRRVVPYFARQPLQRAVPPSRGLIRLESSRKAPLNPLSDDACPKSMAALELLTRAALENGRRLREGKRFRNSRNESPPAVFQCDAPSDGSTSPIPPESESRSPRPPAAAQNAFPSR
jgi:hypothetical protein